MSRGWFCLTMASVLLSSIALAQDLTLGFVKTTTANNLAGGFTQNPNCIGLVNTGAGHAGTFLWNIPSIMHSSPGFVNPLCISKIQISNGDVTDFGLDLGNSVAPNTKIEKSVSKDGNTAVLLYKNQGSNSDQIVVLRSNVPTVGSTFVVNTPSSNRKDIKVLSDGSAFILFSINPDSSTKVRRFSTSGAIAWEINLQTSGLPNKLNLLSNDSRFILATTLRAYVFDATTGDLIYSSPLMFDAETNASISVSDGGSFVIAGRGKVYSFTPENGAYRSEESDYGVTSDLTNNIATISRNGLRMAAIEVRDNLSSRLVIFERGSMLDGWQLDFERIFSSTEGGLKAQNVSFLGDGNSLVVGLNLYSQLSNPVTADIEVFKKNTLGDWVSAGTYNAPGALNSLGVLGQSKIVVMSGLSDGRTNLSVYSLRRR